MNSFKEKYDFMCLDYTICVTGRGNQLIIYTWLLLYSNLFEAFVFNHLNILQNK